MPVGDRPAPTTDTAPLVSSGRLIKQPGDGSCIYHSLHYGLVVLCLASPGAATLRVLLAEWAAKQDGPRGLRVSGKTLKTWLHWESGGTESLAQYAQRQAVSGWGGVVEIIGTAFTFQLTVEVWIPTGKAQYTRTAVFEPDGTSLGVVTLCRTDGVHYDYLELSKRPRGAARAKVRPHPHTLTSLRLRVRLCTPLHATARLVHASARLVLAFARLCTPMHTK